MIELGEHLPISERDILLLEAKNTIAGTLATAYQQDGKLAAEHVNEVTHKRVDNIMGYYTSLVDPELQDLPYTNESDFSAKLIAGVALKVGGEIQRLKSEGDTRKAARLEADLILLNKEYSMLTGNN